MNSPHFLFRIYYTICGTKSQEALEKFFENYREGGERGNTVVSADGFSVARLGRRVLRVLANNRGRLIAAPTDGKGLLREDDRSQHGDQAKGA